MVNIQMVCDNVNYNGTSDGLYGENLNMVGRKFKLAEHYNSCKFEERYLVVNLESG